MPNIIVSEMQGLPEARQTIEYVERKGKGHPDSLIDGIAETASIELSKYYLDNFGVVLHHNLDKGLIVGGSSEVTFGKGRITSPIQVIIAGRATYDYQGAKIPVDDIVKKAVRDYLAANTRFLDLDNDVRISTQIRRGSTDLSSLFMRSMDVPLANDTSFGVGYAPLTKAEELVLKTERTLNGVDYKKRMPASGEDIKVMCIREGDAMQLNTAVAFVAQHTKSIDEYIAHKQTLVNDIRKLASGTGIDADVKVNSGDLEMNGDVYLTKSGLSCESGDDGQIGRGNRANGLISPFRFMSMEAIAGKNPVSHTGKIYNILAREIAADIVKLYPQIEECNVALVSYIGERIDMPRNLTVRAIMKKGESFDAIKSKVKGVAEDALSDINYVTRGLAEGKYDVF